MDKKRIEALRKIYECKDPSKKVVLVKGKKINEANELTSSPYRDKIGAHFDYSGDFDFLDVVAKITERAVDKYENQDDDFKDINDAIYEAMDEGLIYYNDQWKVLEHYLNPQDANWDEAIELFTNDLYELVSDIVDGDDTDESLNESEDKLNLDDYADDDNEDRDVWDVVYDEVFGVGGKDTNFYRSQEEGESDASVPEDDHKFFDFKNSEKKFSFLNDNDAIGVHDPADIERVKRIADKYGVKYKEGKSGKSIIVLIPKNLLNKPAIKYMKDRGLKTIRRFRDISKEQAKKN